MAEDEKSAQDVHLEKIDDDQENYGADPLLLSAPDSKQLSPLYIEPTLSSPSSVLRVPIKRKLYLLLPLLLCIYLLTDSDYHDPNLMLIHQNSTEHHQQLPPKRHHLAFVTALSRHPPSLRVFRIVSEGAFLLLFTAFALWVWESSIPAGGASPANNNEVNIDHQQGDNFMEKEDWEPNNPSEKSSSSSVQITPQVVGKLLFAPPPNSITSNAAWEILYRKHQSYRRRKRRKRKSSSDNVFDNEYNSEEEDTPEQTNNEVKTTTKTEEAEDNEPTIIMSEEQQQSSPLPPSSSSVLGAALDILTLMCMFLIFFTISSAEGGRFIDQKRGAVVAQNESWMKFIAKIASPLFPLALFVIAVVMVTSPWRKRKVIWTIVSLTIGAPFYDVTFRDGFIGDILTSTVRPLQDLAFTVFFLPLGLKAWWSSELYTLDAAAIPLERSWLLHTVVIPACTLSPLWWRFLQNLRQCYDAKHRWPYLGNALKYLLAAEVAVFGMFDPAIKSSPLWLMCFLLTTLYQIWWDVFMDWGLLERNDTSVAYYYGGTSSGLFWWWPYTLRSQRLYQHTWVYYAIFGINFCLRFVGMLTLIPPVYLSRTTGLIVNTYNDPDFQLFTGSMIASAEIFRRTIWALLRLEWEVIKTSAQSRKEEVHALEQEEDMKPMAIASSSRPAWPFAAKRKISFELLNDMSNLNDIQILSELSVWATFFSGIAIIAAAHREVL